MKPKFYKTAKFVFGTILITFLLYLSVLLWKIWPVESTTLAQAGVFGDSFGILTAFFSALAFGGLMLTIWQQQDEIQFNRKEIKNQNFDNSFFRMLETHNILVSGIDIRNPQTDAVKEVGRGCFFVLYEELRTFYNNAQSQSGDIHQILESYEEFWKKWQKDLGHYFRYLYNVLKHVERSKIDNKRDYTNIVRAQLSDHELLIIFYNCLYVHGNEKFKPIVERYTLFNNLPSELLLDSTHKALFYTSAYEYC